MVAALARFLSHVLVLVVSSLNYFKMYAWSVYKHAVVAAFCIYAQSGDDAAKKGGWRQCIK